MKPLITSTFDDALIRYVKGVQKLCDDAKLTGGCTVSVMRGRRYVRVVKDWGGQRTVHSFVQIDNGDVLKAEGWKAPAMHARGNIYDKWNGLSRVKWTGPEYL